MKLIKYEPVWNESLSELDNLFARVFRDRLLAEAYEDWSAAGSRAMRLDSYEADDGYHVLAELPGVPKEAVEVKLENAVLTISGQHQSGQGVDEREIKFSRSITVGDDVSADGVTAKLENGLLSIHLPKLAARRPRSISVQ